MANNFNIIYILLIVSLFLGKYLAQTVDLTLVPNSKGEDVVDAVIKKIRKADIFPQDNEILIRAAYVETKFGQNSSYGLWNVDDNILSLTKNIAAYPSLTTFYFHIANKFGISWFGVTSNDLLKPLYSGLAVHLSFTTKYTTIPPAIPSTLEEQATFWFSIYHKAVTRSVQSFINDVKVMESRRVCEPTIDICFVLDGSGSVGINDFNKARDSIYKNIDSMHSDMTRFCFILYSSGVTTVFSLNNKLSKTQLLSLVSNIKYPNDMTNTRGAITEAINIFVANPNFIISRILYVITDGYSNYPSTGVQPAPTNALNNGIISNAVGIGPDIRMSELLEIANGFPDRVSLLKSYQQFYENGYKLFKDLCAVALQPPMNYEFKDRLLFKEKRYYNYKITSTQISVILNESIGSVVGYYSFTEPNPTPAMYDGVISKIITLTGVTGQLFVAVEGLSQNNHYSITVK